MNDQADQAATQPKTKSKRRILKFIALFIALIVVLLVGAFSTVSYMKANGQPYSQEIDEELIPTYTQVALAHTHQHDGSSLPMIGSCIIDIDGDRVPEVFLGGGKDQKDAIFRYSSGQFETVENCAGVSKKMPDAT